jgi:peptide chain release factor 2
LRRIGGIFDVAGREGELTKLEQRTSSAEFWNERESAQATLQKIKSLKAVIEPWNALSRQLSDTLELAHLVSEEPEEEQGKHTAELEATAQQLANRARELELRSMLAEENDINNCYLYIHPGAGGTESCDWAEMLMRMYLRWCDARGYRAKPLDLQPGDEAGIRSATIFVEGEYAYGYLKAESGVHRLVRISPFDANHRRHTSFASVYASPEVDETIDVDIKDSDLRIDTYRSSGRGGQHVNVTDSAVRITHLPTHIVVACQNERSQHKNKALAMQILRSRLYQYYLEKRREELAAMEQDKKDIAWGSQIRSYVFHPYNLVKDHRTGVETSNTQAVMDGEIDMFIEGYLRQQMKSCRE